MSFLLLFPHVAQNWNMSQEIRNRIANNVKCLRVDKKLRREELSLLLGFDNSYISKLERGSVNITIDRLSKVAEYFGVDVSFLLKDH
jgi:transcriptional regulator with XRE-family HTH domain